MRTLRIAAVLLAALAPCAPEAAAADDEKSWTVELGVMAGHRDNFFFRGDQPGTPVPSADVLDLWFDGEFEFEAGPGDLALLLEAGAMMTNDIDGADNERGGLEVQYELGRTRFSGKYALNPNRIFSEDGEGTFFDLSGLGLEVRHKWGRGFWIGGSYETDDWEFDPLESDRDADSTEYAATFRFPLGGKAGVRATLLTEEKDARAPDNDWSGDGFALALELNPGDRVQIFARYKRREREYDHAPSGDSNFGREDTIQDALLNLRVLVGEPWGIQAQAAYRDGESTRPDRNYDAHQISAGVFVRF